MVKKTHIFYKKVWQNLCIFKIKSYLCTRKHG